MSPTASEIPRLKKLDEAGEVPFQFIELQETILEGWNSDWDKLMYLFKMEDGSWGYYDNGTQRVVPIMEWKGKSARVEETWVPMSKKRRLHLRFVDTISFSNWDHGRKYTAQSADVIAVVTESAYESLVEQSNGRTKDSVYRFSFKTRKNKKGGTMTFVDKIVYAGELDT